VGLLFRNKAENISKQLATNSSLTGNASAGFEVFSGLWRCVVMWRDTLLPPSSLSYHMESQHDLKVIAVLIVRTMNTGRRG
jgi:hypothetical protein